jgi:hypothetical protein
MRRGVTGGTPRQSQLVKVDEFRPTSHESCKRF